MIPGIALRDGEATRLATDVSPADGSRLVVRVRPRGGRDGLAARLADCAAAVRSELLEAAAA
jgi:hypothetical protein